MKPQSGRALETGTTPFTRAVGAELRRCLRERGMEQKDLAALLETSPSWVSLVCSGKKNVTIARLEAAFAALGYRLDLVAAPTPAARQGRTGRMTA